jgi:serine/threonine protein kinase
MQLAAGTHLGPYEICSSLGAGGMGEVYKARDPRLGRFVAIKVLLEQKLDNANQRRRFQQEARAASALNHPGIVTVYDVGSEHGMDYIAMEFVEGQTLDKLIPQNGFPIPEFLQYSTEAADAIAKAHSARILHRDLKPGNVIVTTDGHVKVLDFGLAKVIEAPQPEEKTAVAAITDEGCVVGTAAYMSPEQAEGKSLDNRSDIFSFGAVMYEMATGQKAFKADTAMSTILCILRDEPKSVRELRRETPPELDRLIRRCLRKDPARRIQTMSDLKVALDELKEESDSGRLTAVFPARRQRPRLLWAGLLILFCILAVIAALRLGRHPVEKVAASHPIPITSYQGDERQADFSPNGSQVAFSWNGEKEDNWDIYLKVAGSSATPLRLTSDPAADSRPKWSPDGNRIAFIRSTRETDAIMLTSALGGTERRLTEFPTAVEAGLSWSPDGKWLAVAEGGQAGRTALRLVSVESGESRTLTTPPATSGGDFDPAFSPDGRSLAFVREHGMNVEELWSLPLSKSYEPAGPPRKILADGKRNHGPAWTADGSEFIFSSGETAQAGMYRIPADGSAPPTRIDSLGDGVSEPVLSSSSHRLAFTRTFRSASIWRFDTEGKGSAPKQWIASSSFRDVFPQYSPDGSKIAFYSNRTGANQIWTCNADGSQSVQLTSMTGTTTGTPRWSPNGQWISFDSNSGGSWQIYVVSASGGKPLPMTSGEMTNVVASWSRDGQWIYFTSKRSVTAEVWKIHSPSGARSEVETPLQVTRNGGTSSLESPDGKTLYFTKTTPGFDFSLWRMPVGGGSETEVLASLHRYNFTVTPAAIYFTTPSAPDSPAELKKLDLATGKVTSFYTLNKRVDLGLALSPDGRYLLFAQLDYVGSDLMAVENFR